MRTYLGNRPLHMPYSSPDLSRLHASNEETKKKPLHIDFGGACHVNPWLHGRGDQILLLQSLDADIYISRQPTNVQGSFLNVILPTMSHVTRLQYTVASFSARIVTLDNQCPGVSVTLSTTSRIHDV